jgi:hypothetical protein
VALRLWSEAETDQTGDEAIARRLGFRLFELAAP